MGERTDHRMLFQPIDAMTSAASGVLAQAKKNIAATDFSISPSLSRALDILRALAAFLVVANHIGEALFVFEDHLDPLSLLMFQFLYLGHHAVMLLFVVSGFLIGRAAMQCFTTGKHKVFDYGLDRITRIYVVLIPALALGYVSDQILLAVSTGSDFDYVAQRTSWLIFLGNAVGLQTILVPTFGSNGPLWSLACELWYYFMAPAFFVALFGERLINRLIALAAFLAALFFVSEDILHYGVIWCIGVMCWAPRRPWLPKWLAWGLMIGFLATANNEYLWAHGWGFPHIFGTALTVALIINAHRHDRVTQKATRPSLSKFFAGFTYSLYLYHYPLLMIVLSLLMGNHFVPYGRMGVAEALATIGLLALLYVYSYGLFWLTERKYLAFRDFVRNKAAPLKRLASSAA